MQQSKSELVYKRRKRSSNKKHKSLDAICEKAYNTSHSGVEPSSLIDGGNVRRSGRTRKPPVLLDSSPRPPKKRQKVVNRDDDGVNDRLENSLLEEVDGGDDSWKSRLRSKGSDGKVSSLKGKRKLFEDFEGPTDDVDNEDGIGLVGEKSLGVRSKRTGKVKGLDSLGNEGSENDEETRDEVGEKTVVVKSKRIGKVKGLSSLGNGESENDEETRDDSGNGQVGERTVVVKSKRIGKVKGLDSLGNEGTGNDVESWDDSGNGQVGEKTVVVKSKRIGKVKGLNSLENEDKKMDLVGGAEDCDDDVVGEVDKGDELLMGTSVEPKSDVGEHVSLMSDEKEGTAIQSELQLEECDSGVNINVETNENDDNLETGEEDINVENMDGNIGADELALEPDDTKEDAADVDCAADDTKDRVPDKPVEDEACNKLGNEHNVLHVVNHKSRIKLGRRCGLCGCGTDGKPPKVRQRDGDGSDNGEYSGSSAYEEPNYDVWDGFGDESGWLGRLLGPIKDRFGLAGIWVHQQCAVWSPEVYFAGVGCLKNIRAALYRGRALKCSRCRRPGATTGCRVDRCPKTYHVPCARAKGCIFDHRKFLIACTDHRHLFQPHGIQNAVWLKKMKSKRMKLELQKMSNDAHRKDIEAEEKCLEKCGEDEEFVKRESKRLQRDLCRIAPVYIGGGNSENGTTPFQGWESVAGLQNVIECMKEVVILPLLYPEFFNNLGLKPPRGVLLHGYPGTGKTLIVRALVGACARGDKRIAYFARKGADCLGKYVGDAERQLRLLFQVAEKSQPSIIFFDEIDGLAPCRNNQQDQTHSSVVSTLLALMDGLKSRGSVVVIGATNRPDAVDPALRRPGRFDREIYFPLPSLKDREAILSLHTQKWPKQIEGSLLNWVARQTVGFAGADIQALSTQAAMFALKRNFPLQDVLSAAETKPSHSSCLSIPHFSVEERDWLQALSCAPPPCSRREFGAVVNDVIASPLDTFLVPCLLQPLTRTLIHLSLNERIWLPPPLINASRLVKNVVNSAWSNMRRVQQSDEWWLHVDELLQDMNVTDEIEKNLLLAKVLVRQTNDCSSDEIEKFSSKSFSSNSQILGASSRLHKNTSYASSQSGFQMLISGNPRSGQRHLASCLLHCFVGNVDIWKVDLASISLEGHGDMVHGLTRILMRCASANGCLIYMPRIDLWAIETYNEASEDHQDESYSVDLQTTGMITCNGRVETDRETELSPSSGAELRKASCLWTCFINQVESMRVNASLLILATSELPFSYFPDRVRQFFGDEIMNCNNLSSPLDHKVPSFCVQLDGKFDNSKVMNSFAVKLSKDLTQNFVQSVHNRNHGSKNPTMETTHEKVVHEGVSEDADHSKPTPPVCSVNQVAPSNKVTKGKSTSVLAISALGYQLLCYPHFAELCWVTSKLKAGPHANTNGPWKGWPFNSCVIGSLLKSTDQVVTASSSNPIKSKEFGVVRGLVAVGLSAYRAEYSSPREICLEVRKVLEALVERVNDRIQAGVHKSHFIRLLSQVAYLEDLVTCWAYNLRSLEVETGGSISQENHNFTMLSSDNHVLKEDAVSELDKAHIAFDDLIMKEGPELEGLQNTDVKGGGEHFDLANGGNPCINASDDVGVTINKSSQPPPVLDHTSSCLTPEAVNLQESAGGGDDGNCASVKQLLSNGFTESSSGFQTNVVESHPLSPPTQVSDRLSNGPSDSFNGRDNMSSNTSPHENSAPGGVDNVGGNSSKPSCPIKYSPATTCFHQCCSECFANLHSLVLRIISTEWGVLKGRGIDSTTNAEDVFDFLSSLSVKLNSTLFKLLSQEAETLSDSNTYQAEGSIPRNFFKCRKCHETDTPDECKDPEKRLMMECRCHTGDLSTRNDENFPHSLAEHSCFVFRNGVLEGGSLDSGGPNAPYHCKYQKLCLCFLIEMVGKEQGAF